MKKASVLFALFLIGGGVLIAQVGINTDNSATDPTAMLDVKSTSKGALIPRMNSGQIAAIQKPAGDFT